MPPRSTTPPRAALALPAMLLAAAGMAAVWALLAVWLGRQSSWMAVITAADLLFVAWLMRLRRGALLASLSVAGTALAIWLANWWIAAAQMARGLGIHPWESVPKIGPELAWMLMAMANGRADHLWWLAALLAAAIGGVALGKRAGH